MVSEDESTGTRVTLKRDTFKGGSLVFIIIMLSVSAFCLFVAIRMVGDSPVNPFALLLFVLFPAFALPASAWEAMHLLPARFELGDSSARYYLNGKLREEITFGPSVKADVRLDCNRVGPRPKAFDSCCDVAEVDPDRGDFLLLCGICLTEGDRSISISHDDGWHLVDFSELWNTFLDVVVEHDMEIGGEMWRYIEFRDGFQPLAEDAEPDIFERIRDMEV